MFSKILPRSVKNGVDFVQTLSGTAPGQVRDRSRTGLGQVGTGPGQVRDRSGTGPGQVRDRSGTSREFSEIFREFLKFSELPDNF